MGFSYMNLYIIQFQTTKWCPTDFPRWAKNELLYCGLYSFCGLYKSKKTVLKWMVAILILD